MSKKKRLRRKKTAIGRAVPMSPEVQRAMEGQLQRFREKFGRDPGPDDPVFFDPDADTPQELDWDKIRSEIVGGMVKAGIEPEKVYAYRKTWVYCDGTELGPAVARTATGVGSGESRSMRSGCRGRCSKDRVDVVGTRKRES